MMKLHLYIFMVLTLTLVSVVSVAQKGLPSRKTTHSSSVTKYAQHLDFHPYMKKWLKVPKGWELSIAASGLGRPRMLHQGSGGKMYITRRDAGDVLLLQDQDGDNIYEDVQTVANELPTVHGITSRDGYMYLCGDKELCRYPIAPDGTFGGKEILISDLPNGGQHPNRTIAFGPDGLLYISVGSVCNDCKDGDAELATMLQVNTQNWSRTVYAMGLRNTIGFDFHPLTGDMWGIDNGGDAKGNRWPPEELNRIRQGGNYGFPYVYGKQKTDQTREEPTGTTKESYALNTVPSVKNYRAHQAPIGFAFFGNRVGVPEAYKDDALVCWHGSWNSRKPVGFKVQRIKFENDMPVGTDNFLRGFLRGGFLSKKKRFGRPAGVLVSTSGVVYVSDDVNGVVYAIKRKS
jgi:glucose/arabinose dehydrogenase